MLSVVMGGGGKGQSLEDKLYAVKYFISGQALSLVVLKATTSQLLGPKKKHLNYLVRITHEPNVSIPNLVKYLMQRASHPEWNVAFKSLITIHYLMSYGNEKFIQNMASSTVNKRTFDHLASFVDATTSQAYDMSTFLRRYSRYVNVKIQTYRSLGLDFCKIKLSPSTSTIAAQTLLDNNNNNSGADKSPFKMKSISLEQLLRTLPVLQDQFDSLLAFDASAKDLNNGVITSAFSMLYKDFVNLYIIYQTAIIRLLDLYFKLTQVKRVQELLEGYKKFLVRMDKVSDFMRVIDSVGMDKGDMPNLSRLPDLTLSTLENHLKQLTNENKNRYSVYQSATVVELPRIQSDCFSLTRKNSRNFRGSFRTPTSLNKKTEPTKQSKHSSSTSSGMLESDSNKRICGQVRLNELREAGLSELKYIPFNNKDQTNKATSILTEGNTSTESSTSSTSSTSTALVSSVDKRKREDHYYQYCELDPIQRGSSPASNKQHDQQSSKTMNTFDSTVPLTLNTSISGKSIYQNIPTSVEKKNLISEKDDNNNLEVNLMIIDDNNNDTTTQKIEHSGKGGGSEKATGAMGRQPATQTPDGWVRVEL